MKWLYMHFRLIREQQHIEQEKIQEKAMLADKEAKFLTYSLMQAGWIQQRELKKGVQKAGPTKTFYLFTIEISQVSLQNYNTKLKWVHFKINSF